MYSISPGLDLSSVRRTHAAQARYRSVKTRRRNAHTASMLNSFLDPLSPPRDPTTNGLGCTGMKKFYLRLTDIVKILKSEIFCISPTSDIRPQEASTCFAQKVILKFDFHINGSKDDDDSFNMYKLCYLICTNCTIPYTSHCFVRVDFDFCAI